MNKTEVSGDELSYSCAICSSLWSWNLLKRSLGRFFHENLAILKRKKYYSNFYDENKNTLKFIYLIIYLLIYFFIYLFTYFLLFIYLFTFLFLFIYLFIYLSKLTLKICQKVRSSDEKTTQNQFQVATLPFLFFFLFWKNHCLYRKKENYIKFSIIKVNISINWMLSGSKMTSKIRQKLAN